MKRIFPSSIFYSETFHLSDERVNRIFNIDTCPGHAALFADAPKHEELLVQFYFFLSDILYHLCQLWCTLCPRVNAAAPIRLMQPLSVCGNDGDYCGKAGYA